MIQLMSANGISRRDEGSPVTTGFTYLTLFAAIVAEVIATTALSRSESFTRLWPSIVTIVGYALAFWLLSFPVRTIPVGVVYALWSGLGILLISAVSWLWYGQKLDLPAVVGLAFILGGVLIVNLFSKTISH
jgi:small multidrug resistance pump